MKNSNKESTVASVVVQRLNAMFLILFQVQPVAVEEDWGQWSQRINITKNIFWIYSLSVLFLRSAGNFLLLVRRKLQ